MSDGVSLTLTPESRQVLQTWSKHNVRQWNETVNWWLTSIGAWGVRESQQGFNEGRQPGGQVWPPNRGRYAAWKASLGSNKPGILNGGLRNSISADVNKTRKETRIGSPLPYAGAVYYGKNQSWAGYVHGPGGNEAFFKFSKTFARPFLPTEEHMGRHMTTLMEQLIRRKMA